MEDSYMRFFAERIYRELIALECIPGLLTSKQALRGLFKIAYDDYKSLEDLCKINPSLSYFLASAKDEIAALLEDHAWRARGKKINIVDKLEIAIL